MNSPRRWHDLVKKLPPYLELVFGTTQRLHSVQLGITPTFHCYSVSTFSSTFSFLSFLNNLVTNLSLSTSSASFNFLSVSCGTSRRLSIVRADQGGRSYISEMYESKETTVFQRNSFTYFRRMDFQFTLRVLKIIRNMKVKYRRWSVRQIKNAFFFKYISSLP